MPEQSVTQYLLVSTTVTPSHVAVITSPPIHLTPPTSSQLSASSVTTNTFGAGMSLKHSTFTVVGFDAVGGVISSTLIVCSFPTRLSSDLVTRYVLVTTTVAPSHVAVVTSSPI